MAQKQQKSDEKNSLKYLETQTQVDREKYFIIKEPNYIKCFREFEKEEAHDAV